MSWGKRDAVKYGQRYETLRGVKERGSIEAQAHIQFEEVKYSL